MKIAADSRRLEFYFELGHKKKRLAVNCAFHRNCADFGKCKHILRRLVKTAQRGGQSSSRTGKRPINASPEFHGSMTRNGRSCVRQRFGMPVSLRLGERRSYAPSQAQFSTRTAGPCQQLLTLPWRLWRPACVSARSDYFVVGGECRLLNVFQNMPSCYRGEVCRGPQI